MHTESTAPGAVRWTAVTAAKRAVEVLKAEGTRALIARLLGETVYRRLLLLERSLEAPLPPLGIPRGFEFGWLDSRDIAAYERLRPGRGAQCAARLAAGGRCFGTWLDGDLVAVGWVAAGSAHIEYLDLAFQLADNEVYYYDSFTSPAHRRHGLSLATQARLFAALEREGRLLVLRAALPENRAAVSDAKKAGFGSVAKIGYIRLGRWRREFGLPRAGSAGSR